MPLRDALDAVLFDVGGVLLSPHPRYLCAVAAEQGVTARDQACVRGHYEGVRAMYEHSLDLDHWPSYHRAMATQLGAGDDARDALAEALHDAMTSRAPTDRWWTYVLPGAVETLRELHRRGVPIGIVSNADGQVEDDLRATGVCQVGEGDGAPVSVIVDSSVVGVAKPDPAIFDPAIEALRRSRPVERHRIAYVGDTVRNDVMGAAAAGLVPVQLDPFGLHHDCRHQRIAVLTDLLTWF